MGKLNWVRIFAGGLIAGLVWGVLEALKFPLVGKDFLAALPRGREPVEMSAALVAFWAPMELVLGVWTIWLYAVSCRHYGRGPKTAALTGFALWIIATWVSAVWASLAAMPLAAFVAPAAADLPIYIVAAMLGAWVYRD